MFYSIQLLEEHFSGLQRCVLNIRSQILSFKCANKNEIDYYEWNLIIYNMT